MNGIVYESKIVLEYEAHEKKNKFQIDVAS